MVQMCLEPKSTESGQVNSPLATIRRLRSHRFVLLGWFAFAVIALFQFCSVADAAPAARGSMPAMASGRMPASTSHGTSLPMCCFPGHMEVCTGQFMTTDANLAPAPSGVLAALPVSATLAVRLPRQTGRLLLAPDRLRIRTPLPLYLLHGRFLI